MHSARVPDLSLKRLHGEPHPFTHWRESSQKIFIGFTPRQFKILYVVALLYPTYTHVNSVQTTSNITNSLQNSTHNGLGKTLLKDKHKVGILLSDVQNN
jgi:hypothetical protein